MIKQNLNSHFLAMTIKKKIVFFLIFISLNNCSFDNKTGIWGESKKEKRRISELEKKQKQILDIEKIYSSENIYSKEKSLTNKIILSKPKNISAWKMSGLNSQNFLGNIYLPRVNNNFLKKKIGKDKFSIHKGMTPLLAFNNNIALSDDTGTIFYINKRGKIKWKKNIYKKIYKRVYKNLVFSIHENNIYVADNIGFIYAINLESGKLVWIKNYGVPIKSNMKIIKNKIFLVDQDNKILCFNTKDGSIIWNILSIASFIKSQNLLSIAISRDGNVFVMTSSADIFKINSESGNVIWSRNTSDSLYANATDFFNSSEIVISDDEIIFSAGSKIFSYDAINGSTNWENEVNTVATPIIDGENIFIVTENGYFVILHKDTGKIISSTNILKILKKKKQDTRITGFIMGSGKIYSVTLNGNLIVSSAVSGKAEYFKKIGEKNIAPLIISSEALYILTENSRIFGFN